MHGSGKTTIALHRIAYLIYNYGKEFYPEEFLIIAPNKFFLNYISNVLPDLGVERVSQMTYEEVAFQIIGKEYKIEDPNYKLSLLIDSHLSAKQKKQSDIMASATSFKSTVRFKNLIDEYIFEVEKRFLPNPEPNWGPGSRSGRKTTPSEKAERRKKRRESSDMDQ